MKVSELSGLQLALWVAKAENLTPITGQPPGFFYYQDQWGSDVSGWYDPTTDWCVGGPIVFRNKISWNTWHGDWGASFTFPVRHPTNPKRDPSHHWMKGPTPLIAAMRTYVSSVYGDEVPEEDQ